MHDGSTDRRMDGRTEQRTYVWTKPFIELLFLTKKTEDTSNKQSDDNDNPSH